MLRRFEYRGQSVAIEVFPKNDGTFAWGFVIGDGDCIGPEGVRASSREDAVKDAMAAAERWIDHTMATKGKRQASRIDPRM
jgi:hypothetical protein